MASPIEASANLYEGVNKRLYVSHFLSTWNSRSFEFGATLFLAAAFPNTLLELSLYAIFRAAAAVLLSSAVGKYIDHGNRLNVVRTSIVGQRMATIASCCLFYLLTMNVTVFQQSKYYILAALCLLSCMEKLSSVLNLIAVERDWVVVVAGSNELYLRQLNAQMRRIDLFCKLVGPLTIALLDGISTQIALVITLAFNAASTLVEYYTIAWVYRSIPALAAPRNSLTDGYEEIISRDEDESSCTWPLSLIKQAWEHLVLYRANPAFLPSLSMDFLHLTVLSFSGQMVTYLLSVGFDSWQVGLLRFVSIIFELSATWLGPALMGRVGPTRAGLWFLTWQLGCLGLACAFFWEKGMESTGALALVVGVVFSRIGLWGFDLSAQVIIQEEVRSGHRGSFSTTEAALQNLFSLCSFASTAIFHKPEQFKYPVLMSVVSVGVADVFYAAFVRHRRGHLIHLPSLFDLKGRHNPLTNSRRSAWRRIEEEDDGV